VPPYPVARKKRQKSRSQEGLQEQTSQSLKIIKNPGKTANSVTGLKLVAIRSIFGNAWLFIE
jgi:hypothetical protein